MELAVFAGLLIVKKFREDEAPVLVSPNLISVGSIGSWNRTVGSTEIIAYALLPLMPSRPNNVTRLSLFSIAFILLYFYFFLSYYTLL